MARLALRAEGHELELLAAVEGEDDEEEPKGAPLRWLVVACFL